jgi:hypothetical protein
MRSVRWWGNRGQGAARPRLAGGALVLVELGAGCLSGRAASNDRRFPALSLPPPSLACHDSERVSWRATLWHTRCAGSPPSPPHRPPRFPLVSHRKRTKHLLAHCPKCSPILYTAPRRQLPRYNNGNVRSANPLPPPTMRPPPPPPNTRGGAREAPSQHMQTRAHTRTHAQCPARQTCRPTPLSPNAPQPDIIRTRYTHGVDTVYN